MVHVVAGDRSSNGIDVGRSGKIIWGCTHHVAPTAVRVQGSDVGCSATASSWPVRNSNNWRLGGDGESQGFGARQRHGKRVVIASVKVGQTLNALAYVANPVPYGVKARG